MQPNWSQSDSGPEQRKCAGSGKGIVSFVFSCCPPLSRLPGLGFSHGLLPAARDGGAPPCRQAGGSGPSSGLPGEMSSVYPPAQSLSKLMDEATRAGRESSIQTQNDPLRNTPYSFKKLC